MEITKEMVVPGAEFVIPMDGGMSKWVIAEDGTAMYHRLSFAPIKSAHQGDRFVHYMNNANVSNFGERHRGWDWTEKE